MDNVLSTSIKLRMTAYSALFTALIIIGGYISIPIPISPIPIVLADFFVMMAGLFMGYKWGAGSVMLYVFLGFVGLPIFAGGKAGLSVIVGPTGGFVFGYLLMAFLIGFISTRGKGSFIKNLAALIVGNISLYTVGILGLKISMDLSIGKAIAVGLFPFIIGIVIKVAALLILARILLPQFKQKILYIKNNTY